MAMLERSYRKEEKGRRFFVCRRIDYAFRLSSAERFFLCRVFGALLRAKPDLAFDRARVFR
jgi:hypothetical protein